MTPEEWRILVGEPIEKRRDQLHPSIRAAAQAAHISEGQWRTIESGRRQAGKGIYFTVNPRKDTKRRLCRALRWTPDSIDRLLRGDEPAEITPQPHLDTTDPTALRREVERLAREVIRLTEEAEDTRRRVMAIESRRGRRGGDPVSARGS